MIKEQHYSVIRPEDYRTQDTVFTFKAPELGAYVMRIIPDIRAKRDSESKFDVTRFKVLTCRLPDKQYQVVTLDGQTGYPIPHAKVTMYSNDEKVLQEFTTNEEEIRIPLSESFQGDGYGNAETRHLCRKLRILRRRR